MTGKLFLQPVAIAALALAPTAASAQTAANTTLTQAQVDKIMNDTCSLSAKYAADVAASKGQPRDIYSRWAYQILTSNISIPKLQQMLDVATKLGAEGNKAEQDVSDFQYCVLINKINYIK